MDAQSKVKDVMAASGKEIGSPFAGERFVRYALGEGIEKRRTRLPPPERPHRAWTRPPVNRVVARDIFGAPSNPAKRTAGPAREQGDHGSRPIYRRVLLKLSGEALMGEGAFGIDLATVDRMAEDIRAVNGWA